MPEARPPAVPPLGVWLAAVGLAGLLLGGSVGVARWAERRANRQFEAEAEALLRREAARPDSVRLAVVLGSSLTEAGVAPVPFFDQRMGGRWRVVRLFRSGANLESFTERSGVLRLLERYPPDVFLLEDHLLRRGLPDGWRVRFDATAPEVLLNWLYFFGKTAWRTGQPDRWLSFDRLPPHHDRPNAADTLHLAPALDLLRRRPPRAFAETPALHASLRRLRERGTRLVLLHFPRPAPLETATQRGEDAARLRRLAADYRRAYGAAYWSYDRPLTFRDFMDYIHLNQAASLRFSAWLADRLRRDGAGSEPRNP